MASVNAITTNVITDISKDILGNDLIFDIQLFGTTEKEPDLQAMNNLSSAIQKGHIEIPDLGTLRKLQTYQQ